MACKCGKNKDCKCSKLLYIMNPNCGWCTKADPVVADLVEKGHKITTLNVTNPEEAQRAGEVQAKHKVQCGTPLFIDEKSGNMVCGFRPDVLEKWASGEEIPAPPPRPVPQQQPQQPPQQPQGPQITKLEYIWLDGHAPKNIRSKTRFIHLDRSKITSSDELLKAVPEWSFDGSSTKQASGESDCILKPVKFAPNTTERARSASFVVLCEVMNPDGTPHSTNTRAKLKESIEDTELEDMWFGLEQEYTIVDRISGKPLGWSDYEDDTPPPQGNYYCGVGADTVEGRDLSESHAMACNSAGIPIQGTNAEVMLSQWEYQTEPQTPLDSSDNVWISRFFLQRLAERMGYSISYHPKPVEGPWNGSGAHINFSTTFMREHADIAYMNLICSSMEQYHKDAISCYGLDNDKRLTGEYETSSIDEISWGEMDRNASIRIPLSTINNDGSGYLEDRRPAANVDPYEAYQHLVNITASINEDMMIAI